MGDSDWQFELRLDRGHCYHPDEHIQVYRSDDIIGDGGRVLLSKGDTRIQVSYRDLPRRSLREIELCGVPVVRLRRATNRVIVGEWIKAGAEGPASTPGGAAPRAANALASASQTESGDKLGSVLQLAGTLFGQSSNRGLRTLGSFLSNVSQEAGKLSGRAPAQESVAPAPAGESIPAPQLAPKSRVAVPRAAAPPQPVTIPRVRICEACAHFRPYVRVWERFQEEVASYAGEEAVSRGLDDLRTHEEKGKGEEARHLADLFRGDADRWNNRPSFFSYCAAHERDPAEPTFFIAQIRNADKRCQPVKRASGQRWSDAATDYCPKDAVPHSCNTCAHRIKAPGPGKDAADVRDIVKSAIAVEGVSAFYGKSGNASSILASYPETTRRNAAAARVREMAQAFASRAMDSHAPSAPRYLDCCSLKSDPARSRYRVCAVENANDCCPEWSPNR